ncbi:hypothetical protein J4410_02425 [Candidatus Woesearchaeota archaeon]|nr:hypothetical protein [Candidatus Woesearchaeota archaeon]
MAPEYEHEYSRTSGTGYLVTRIRFYQPKNGGGMLKVVTIEDRRTGRVEVRYDQSGELNRCYRTISGLERDLDNV